MGVDVMILEMTIELNHWPLQFPTLFTDWDLQISLWQWTKMNATGIYW